MASKIKTKRDRVKFASDNVAGVCPEVLNILNFFKKILASSQKFFLEID